jgi:hypothetical protein
MPTGSTSDISKKPLTRYGRSAQHNLKPFRRHKRLEAAVLVALATSFDPPAGRVTDAS